MKISALLLGIMVMISSWPGYAETRQESLQYLQTQWAIDNYQLKAKAQKQAFADLIEQADRLVTDHPQAAELYIWRGIIQSTYAGIKGGLGALKFAKAAKVDLEKALTLDETALDGSAFTSLGTLYFNVPGWPLGFGDDEKAEKYLKKALTINPDGIDPNYFYGDYLRHESRYHEAKRYMEKALQAKPREGRALADEGRRKEIHQALLEIEKHI